MKSYSNDIPNISTEDMKRNIQTTEESHELIKNNLEAIKKHDKDAKIAFEKATGHSDTNTVLIAVAIVIGVVSIVLQVISMTGGA